MDVRTALIMTTAMALLNGAVLGFMHRTLAADIQPSASDWRIGTLLLAAAPVLLGVQDLGPIAILLPVANGFVFMGFALYLRALRRFYALPDAAWVFAPVALGVALIFVFSAILPDLGLRLIGGSIILTFQAAACAAVLRERHSSSEKMLIAVLLILAAFLAFRAFYFAVVETPGTLLDLKGGISNLTPIVVGSVPVVGTTLFLAMCVDRMRRRWEETAATDYLTGMPNRRTLTTNGEARFNAARRGQGSVAVALIDIDHFKSINDRLGHAAGDAALCHVARVLGSHCRGPSMVGRLGGEEFLAIVEGADAAGGKTAAERLRAACEDTPFTGSGEDVAITISIGVAAIADGDLAFDDLLQRADKALYAAKAAGRNRVLVAD